MTKNKFRTITNHMCQRGKNINIMSLLLYKIPFFLLKAHKWITNTFLVKNFGLIVNFAWLRMLWSQEMNKLNFPDFYSHLHPPIHNIATGVYGRLCWNNRHK